MAEETIKVSKVIEASVFQLDGTIIQVHDVTSVDNPNESFDFDYNTYYRTLTIFKSGLTEMNCIVHRQEDKPTTE